MISIIIPTYNEAGNILLLIEEIKAVLAGRIFEIIIVDDRSTDGTFSGVAARYAGDSEIRLYSRQGERSLGLSILDGIRHASGDIIVGMDADFNHDPQLLPKLIGSLERSDIAVASRFLKGGGMDNRTVHICSLLFNRLLQLLFGFPIRDNTSGYYAIRRVSLERLHPERVYYGYGEYHLRLVYRAFRAGLSIVEIPSWYARRKYGASKSNYGHMIFSYLREAFLLRVSRLP